MGILVEVKANENSTTGGVGAELGSITLNAGDLVSVFCEFSDTWKIYDDREDYTVNANGKISTVTLANGQVFSAGALVGSFDNGATFFSVGLFTQFTVLQNLPNPTLRLYCADSDKDNNSGSIFAHVKVATDRFVPNGSYLRSSRNVNITVNAECEANGTFQPATSVTYSQSDADTLDDIANVNGVLTKTP